jgi:hypothetical protein
VKYRPTQILRLASVLSLRTKGDRIMKAALGLMLAMIGGVVIGAS